jgi:hypothetical protein
MNVFVLRVHHGRIATSKDVFKLQLVKWEKAISDFVATGLDQADAR